MTLHWTYTPKEWERFTEQDWRAQQIGVLVAAMSLGGVFLIIAGCLLLQGLQISKMLFILVPVSLVVFVALALLFLNEYARYQRRLYSTYQARITLDLEGFREPGGFVSLIPLRDVAFNEGSASLSFGVSKGKQGVTHYSIPVPQGHEEEARQFVALLRLRSFGKQEPPSAEPSRSQDS